MRSQTLKIDTDVKLCMGLLGAWGRTYEEAKEQRLQEIERRILALESITTSSKG